MVYLSTEKAADVEFSRQSLDKTQTHPGSLPELIPAHTVAGTSHTRRQSCADVSGTDSNTCDDTNAAMICDSAHGRPFSRASRGHRVPTDEMMPADSESPTHVFRSAPARNSKR